MQSALRRVLDPLLPVARFTKADRRVVFVIWVAGAVQGFAQAQAGASLPFTRAGLGLTEGEMSLLFGVARLGALAALPLGWLGDHGGRRKPFLWAVTLVVAGGSLAGLAVEAWQFGVVHSVLRIGTAIMSGLAVVILAENATKRVRAYAISFYGAAVSLGSGMALMLIPLGEGSPQAWRIPHLLTGLGVLVLPFLIRNVPESEIYEQSSENGHWRELVRGPWAFRFWMVATAGFLASAFGTVGAAFSTERLINQVGVSTTNTVLILLAGGTIGGIGFFAGGHMADAWGRRRTSVLSLVLALAGGMALYSSASLPIVIVAVMVSAFGAFAFVPAGGSHRAELFPTELRSSANTASASGALAGSATGLIAGVWTIDAFGLTHTMAILGVGLAAAALLTLMLPETRGQDLRAIPTERR